MHISLGPLDVYLPSPSDGTFWFAEDLAELVGVEFNADAAEQLQVKLTETGAASGTDIDQEADSVLVSAEDAATMSAVLEALRALAVRPLFTDEELADALQVRHRSPTGTRARATPGRLERRCWS